MPEGSVLFCVVAPVLLPPVLAPPDCGLLCCVAAPPPSRFMLPCALAAEAPATSAMAATEIRKRFVISVSSRVCIALADNEASYDTFLAIQGRHAPSKRRPDARLYRLSIALTPAANVGRKGWGNQAVFVERPVRRLRHSPRKPQACSTLRPSSFPPSAFDRAV